MSNLVVKIVEVTTLCYLEQNDQYLMLYRNKRKNDINGGKWIGVGGHLIEKETIEECLLREVYEETGLTLLSYQLRGILYFDIDGIEEKSYLFTANQFSGELKDCDEGELHWVDKAKINELNLWEGDYYFLERIKSSEDYFEMKLVYKQDRLISHRVVK